MNYTIFRFYLSLFQLQLYGIFKENKATEVLLLRAVKEITCTCSSNVKICVLYFNAQEKKMICPDVSDSSLNEK